MIIPADHPESKLSQAITYLKKSEIQDVYRAYHYAFECHIDQKRRSGEPYITHPVSVACIAANLHLDGPSIIAALLHDVVEDTQATLKEVESKFGKQVAKIVDGLSKLDKLNFNDVVEAQAENFRKMLLAMSSDIRVMIIKLCDRTHNMQTLGHLNEQKRKRIAQETVDIYAPIANRLGLNRIYQELENLCFKHIHPLRHQTITKAIASARGNRKEVVEKILIEVEAKLKKEKIKAEILGREKQPASIHKKMAEKNLGFSEISDIYAFRIIVEDIKDCYHALGVLHSLYKPIPGRFKDYIAIPKANGYQSLHTTLFGPFGMPLEIQIRTLLMNNLAEAGVAAHWMYKTKENQVTRLQQDTNQWLKRLLEIQSDSADSLEFLEHLKVDLFPDEVYVFSPKGKIFVLPKGSTAVDYAYAVHTDVGNSCFVCKINNELVPLRTEVKTGDHIEIITGPMAKPNPSWLNFVITGKARSQIRAFMKKAESSDLVILGYSILNKALKAFHIEPDSIKKKHWDKLLHDYHLKNKDEILIDIALGKRVNIMVAHQLSTIVSGQSSVGRQEKFLDVISIKGSEGMAIDLADCCHPIPGDPILGYIDKDRGLIIHTHECNEIKKIKVDPEKWVDVEWEPNPDRLFKVKLDILVSNERGVLAKIASVIAEMESNIDKLTTEESDGGGFTSIHFLIEVKSRIHLADIIRNLRKIEQVSRITRFKLGTIK
ncbi:guanosine-3',5'-bis(diphosphate) 3'-pyrophosphohydrolase [Methylophilales bacterium MBRSG12]|uniref:Guanosine-3',5'-bis(Diphosphate) 3'-pyrophosphohydrolase n=1 Tax=Methylophilales bacterium MBRS-H7 TaxID=1623450 RepID=A0A0H4J368_9PROT|nr:guanosine-3',5'-bis(diphosphate) 3'-pyrophosphohydrolase [Methylophilales bacterium MBRSF5]AKO66470.1 guanosine-3',5'-bis(diphosphate) 3'-pyrophosphohydrolase [Methylophilales bacterium MBRS-H7]AKO67782.1 guanosine-3',5'-bis(diphosphate) 3'-pyrophosphohydrolase [Methylophilales bacterium MBRSG12]